MLRSENSGIFNLPCQIGVEVSKKLNTTLLLYTYVLPITFSFIPISVILLLSAVSNVCCDLSCFILVIICVVLPQIKTDLVGGGEQAHCASTRFILIHREYLTHMNVQ